VFRWFRVPGLGFIRIKKGDTFLRGITGTPEVHVPWASPGLKEAAKKGSVDA